MWFALVSLAFADPAPTLCAEGEVVAFSCPAAKGRILSVCTSPDLAEGAGWLQYRYGAPRRHDATLAFTNEGVAYKIWEHSDDEGNAAGVTITLANGKTVEVDCSAPATGSLMQIEGSVPQTDF